jgi:hypothetical protein
VAAYTYGPLLGLFTFGIITQRQVRDKWVPWFALHRHWFVNILDKFRSKYSVPLNWASNYWS